MSRIGPLEVRIGFVFSAVRSCAPAAIKHVDKVGFGELGESCTQGRHGVATKPRIGCVIDAVKNRFSQVIEFFVFGVSTEFDGSHTHCSVQQGIAAHCAGLSCMVLRQDPAEKLPGAFDTACHAGPFRIGEDGGVALALSSHAVHPVQ